MVAAKPRVVKTMDRFRSPLAAKIPAVIRSESPGRIGSITSPVSKKIEANKIV